MKCIVYKDDQDVLNTGGTSGIMEGYEVVLSGGEQTTSSTNASYAKRTAAARNADREAAWSKYKSYLTVVDVVAANKGVNDVVKILNPKLDNTWRGPNSSCYGCVHNCPKGSLGKLPGTSAYGQHLNNYYGNMDHAEREDYIQSCIVVSQEGEQCVVPDNKVCKMKLYFCDKTCPFTRFEKQVLTSDNKEIEIGYKNPVLFKNDATAKDMHTVRADHAMGDWHTFWTAVKMYRTQGIVQNPPDSKTCRNKMLNFNQFRNLCAFNCMLNYQFDEETQTEVKCEINDYININIGLYQDAIRFLKVQNARNEGNPWLYAFTYDQFSEMVVSRETMLYAALYKFGKSMVAQVGAHIVAKFCNDFSVNNNKPLPDIPPKVPSGKRAKPDDAQFSTEFPLFSDMPSAAASIPQTSGLSGPTVAMPSQNFWQTRYPDPSPSDSMQSPRKKAQPTVPTASTKQAPTFVRQKQRATLPAGEHTRPASLLSVPQDNNMFFSSSPLPNALGGAAQGAAFGGAAQGGLLSRENKEREGNFYQMKMESCQNMILQSEKDIHKLTVRARSHKEHAEMLQKLQTSANTNEDVESANKYSIQLQKCMDDIQLDSTQLGVLFKKHEEQSQIYSALKAKYQTSVAVNNRLMLSLPQSPAPSDVPVRVPSVQNNMPGAGEWTASNGASSSDHLMPPGMDPNSIDALIHVFSTHVANMN